MQIANVVMPVGMMKSDAPSQGLAENPGLFTGMLEALLTEWPGGPKLSEALVKPSLDSPAGEKPEQEKNQDGEEAGFEAVFHPEAVTIRMSEPLPDGKMPEQGSGSLILAESRPVVSPETGEQNFPKIKDTVQNVLSESRDFRQSSLVAKEPVVQIAQLGQAEQDGKFQWPEEPHERVLTTQNAEKHPVMPALKGTSEVHWQREVTVSRTPERAPVLELEKMLEGRGTLEQIMEAGQPVTQTNRQEVADRLSETVFRWETGLREPLEAETGQTEPVMGVKEPGPPKEVAGLRRVSEDGQTVEPFRMELAEQQSQVRHTEGRPEQVDRIVENLMERVEQFRTDGKDVLRMRLYPEELGRLEIRVEMRDGILSGRLLLETEEARQWMAREIGALSAQLEARGVAFEQLEVVSGQSWQNPAGQFGQGSQEGPVPHQSAAWKNVGQNEAEPVQRSGDRIGTGRLDLLA